MPTDPPVRPPSAEAREQHASTLEGMALYFGASFPERPALLAAIAALRADPEAREREAFEAGWVDGMNAVGGLAPQHLEVDDAYAAYLAAEGQK